RRLAPRRAPPAVPLVQPRYRFFQGAEHPCSLSILKGLPNSARSEVFLTAFAWLLVLVRLDDLVHQGVPDDVLFAEVDDPNSVDFFQAMYGVREAAPSLFRQIDLRNIAGDDDFRAVAHARQEH